MRNSKNENTASKKMISDFVNRFIDFCHKYHPGMTDAEMAKEIGYGSSTFCNYSAGVREPGFFFVLSALEYCKKHDPNYSAEEFLGLTNVELGVTSSVSDFTGLSNEAITKLRVMKDNNNYLKLINWIIENDALINFVDLFTEADKITDERDKKVLQFDQEMICRKFADEIINNRNKIKRPTREDSLIYDNVKYELKATNLTKERAEATLEYLKLNREKKENKED